MTVDRRLAPGENLDEVLKGFTSIMKFLKTKDPDFNGDIKVLSHFEAGVTPTESELIQTVKGSIEAVTDRTPKVTVMAGSCDMRYFQASEIPTVIYGPGNMELAHQTDEYVEIWQLVLAAKVYALTAMKLLGIRI